MIAHLAFVTVMVATLQPPHQAAPVNACETCLGSLVVRIEGFRSAAGQARVSLFSRASGFPDKESAAFRTAVTNIGHGHADVRFDDLPWADYAVAIHHDENGDGTMNRRLFGSPKEGYGVSNNIVHPRRAPAFDEARVRLESPTRTVTISVHYWRDAAARGQLL